MPAEWALVGEAKEQGPAELAETSRWPQDHIHPIHWLPDEILPPYFALRGVRAMLSMCATC
ncbi:hypothetical protein BOTBODRAFT_30683 [Botryobasidium botryosum FD-172 SS1]|uniref:Uncharacterized protein n=1 Tax=Botryobasidium botryosum (strain FD-172 SS1) TaxID=930990 RepID=A0A067MM15_BOTB1|nr:hypothetical protein BOTBODRAFT_30683 [Botryobasidium botryosum FD-172 SS1]